MRYRAVATAGAVVALIGTFLTWLRSGSAARSSYELFGLVERLGFSEGGIVGLALRIWPLVPLLLVVAVIAIWIDVHPVATGVVVAVAGLYPGATALAILSAPQVGLFSVGPGPATTVIGVVTMVGATALVLVSSSRRERPVDPSAPAVDRS